MIHLLLRLIIRLHFFLLAKISGVHYIIQNVQIYFRSGFLKRLSDTSDIMKAQTHWLPLEGRPMRGSQMQQRM